MSLTNEFAVSTESEQSVSKYISVQNNSVVNGFLLRYFVIVSFTYHVYKMVHHIRQYIYRSR